VSGGVASDSNCWTKGMINVLVVLSKKAIILTGQLSLWALHALTASYFPE